jgi:hypothetical protein
VAVEARGRSGGGEGRGATAWLLVLAAVSTLSAWPLAGACANEGAPKDDGWLRLIVAASGGTAVDEVRYEVASSTGILLRSGTVRLAGTGAATSFQLALPPGEGDTVVLTATSATGVPLSGATGPFNIVSRRTTVVSVTLAVVGDGGGAPGELEVNGTIVPLARPPVIAFLTVSPLEVAAGTPIQVSVSASDPAGSDTLSYAWTATPDGLFASASWESTSYTSATEGKKVLTITVGSQRSPVLTASASVSVTIGATENGDGGAR